MAFKLKISYIILLFLIPVLAFSQNNRWKINPDQSISWIIKDNVSHIDNIEMSGEQISTIVHYGIDSAQSFLINRNLHWPMLRLKPNKTFDNLSRVFNISILDYIFINGIQASNEKVEEIKFNGVLNISSFIPNKDVRYGSSTINGGGLKIQRVLFPSVDKPLYLEKYIIKNSSKDSIYFELPPINITYKTNAEFGIYGSYQVTVQTSKEIKRWLLPREDLSFHLFFSAYEGNEIPEKFNGENELTQRLDKVDFWQNNLVLETPDSILNQMFSFAKIRASESLFRTKAGLFHSPGGGQYYAAIWANDQAEYVGPFFPFLGYKDADEASLNAYMQFAKFMNPEYKPIPSSIISEMEGIWNGAGDRGDAAMIAYGAGLFALAKGDKTIAQKLWPLIRWSLEYCKRRLNASGVVMSESSELEGRFPVGNANLATSSLYYDALISAAFLAKDLNLSNTIANTYYNQAKTLKFNIDSYFGANVQGFDTYRFFKENTVLRAWICMPLAVGIFDRKDATISALFSDKMWTEDGLTTESGLETFWDRATLYALKGVFAAGETEKAFSFLKSYSKRRLLGNHVPYAVEAYPEGNQRHLSAESGLYCRVFTEGLFGIRPTGLKSFSLTPQLSEQWDKMQLKKIRAFNDNFDILVKRISGSKIQINIIKNSSIVKTYRLKAGQTVDIHL